MSKDGQFSLAMKQPSLTIFNGQWGWFHDQHKFLCTMMSLFSDESDRLIGKHFYANKKFASIFEPNGALFWGNDPEFILVTKNAFQWYITCLCLKSFAKKSHFFEINCKKNQSKLHHFACRANRYSESESESTLRFVLMPWIQWRSQNWKTSFL